METSKEWLEQQKKRIEEFKAEFAANGIHYPPIDEDPVFWGDLPPPLFGNVLKHRTQNVPEHVPLIEGLLYEHDSLMVAADSGKGKSLIAMQAAMHLSRGTPVFGSLKVKEPMKVWYIQTERHENESLERINKLEQNVGVDWNNLYVDPEIQVLNFLNPAHYDRIERRGRMIAPKIIIIDPLYGVAQGLSQDKIAAEISKCFTMLKRNLNCTIWINHHIVKDQYSSQTGSKVERDDPFYGATWIRAHVTGSYYAKQIDTGMEFIKKKDNHDVLLDHIVTNYDPETYVSTVDPDRYNYSDRFKVFINIVFSRTKKTFLFGEARGYVGCAVRTMRNLVNAHPFKDVLIRHKSSGSNTLYEVNGLC